MSAKLFHRFGNFSAMLKKINIKRNTLSTRHCFKQIMEHDTHLSQIYPSFIAERFYLYFISWCIYFNSLFYFLSCNPCSNKLNKLLHVSLSSTFLFAIFVKEPQVTHNYYLNFFIFMDCCEVKHQLQLLILSVKVMVNFIFVKL